MLKIIASHAKTLAILWLIIITVLFFLPGSAFPKDNWLKGIQFDKWVHVGFFALLLFLWRFFWPASKKLDALVLIVAMMYGVGIECIQHFFVANRSFDPGDVIADVVGAIAGVVVWNRYIKK